MNAFQSKMFLGFVYAFFCLLVKVSSRCDGSDPPTLKRVTLDMIAGRWFTQSVLRVFPNDGIPDDQFFTEFALEFLPRGKVVFNGRTLYAPYECLYNTVNTRSIRKQSSFSAFVNYLNKDVELRILDTDFDSYVLLWGCVRFDSYKSNRCTDWLADVLTKRVDGKVSKKAQMRIEQGLKRTICRRELPPRIPDPKRICKRVSKPYGKGYGRRNHYW